MSGRKPRSSISSASSRTRTLTLPRIRSPRWARSSSRPGRADDDLDALLQRLDLRLERAAAVDGLHADAALGAGGGQVAGDLHAELTGGDDDQRLRDAVATLGRRDDALQHRDAEAEGLAGAGAGLADEVVAGQRQRERQLLDGEGAGDPDLGQRGDDVGVHVEVAEQRAVGGDGGAAQLLDLRLELLGSGRAGLGVLELGTSVASGTWGCSRWRSVLSPLVCWGRGPAAALRGVRTCPGRLSRDRFQRQRSQQNRASVRSARETAPRGRRPAVVSAQIHSAPDGSPIPIVAWRTG